ATKTTVDGPTVEPPQFAVTAFPRHGETSPEVPADEVRQMLFVERLFQPPRREEGGDRERHEKREQRRDDDRQAELPEDLADQTLSESDRAIHDDIGHCNRHGGETDL